MLEKYALIRAVDALISENRELTMLELSRTAKTSIGMTKLILDYLLEKGLVEKRQINKKSALFIISDNFLSKQIKILKILIEIHQSELIDELKTIHKNNLLSVILFGSCADGSYDKSSDIDLLIITRKKAKHKILKSQSKLSRELNILLYTLSEWKDKAKKDPVFYEKIILNSITLYGEKPVVN